MGTPKKTRLKAGFFTPGFTPTLQFWDSGLPVVIMKGEPDYMIQKLAWIALAGALGTLSRYGLAGLVHRLNGAAFPWGTLAVNLAGCFLAGLLWELFENRWPVSAETRVVVLVGFMGAFTTFSAFILETGNLLRASEWISAAANMALQNGFGMLALFAGVALGRMA